MNKIYISIIYKTFICLIGIFSIIATTGILDNNYMPGIFTMFTTLSNVLCVLYFIIDIVYLIKNRHKKRITTWCPVLKGMAMMCITVTFFVAEFILNMSFSFDCYSNISFLGLHYIVPLMTVFDWLFFDKKGLIKKNSPLIWCILPYSYFVIAMISAHYGNGLGVYTDTKYPYPFMDIDKLGLGKVSITLLLLSLCFILFGYIFYFIDKKMAEKK